MSDQDDDDDLIGSRTAKSAPAKAKAEPYGGDARADAAVVQALTKPVSVSFLANIMGMKRDTVIRKLATLPPVGSHRGGTPTYNFRQALAYLVTPRIDPAEIIKNISSTDLPPSLQKDVWDAKLKMQKWQREAGELWPTEDVLETLGDAFKRLKTTTQLWIDQITDSQALSPAVRQELTVLVDALQMDLHSALVEMPKERATKSQLGEIEGTVLDD